MKLLALLLISFPLAVAARVNKEEQKDKPQGKVKSVTEQEYVIRKMSFVKGRELDNKLIYQYDVNGNETEVLCYLKKRKLDYKIVSAYDGKNRLTESLLYYSMDAPVIPDTRSAYIYDDKGNQTEQDDYNPKGSLLKKQAFTYDESGNQSAFISYNADNSMEYRSVNKFDAAGNKTREEYYTAKDSLEFTISYKYDAEGREAEEDYFGPDDSLAFKLTYKYEDIDNQGNWLKETVYENGKTEVINKRQIAYY